VIPYALIFFYTFFKSLSSSVNTKPNKLEVFLIIFILTIFIGTRQEIGADWLIYLNYLERTKDLTIAEIFNFREPLFILLNSIFANSFYGIYFVNSICAFIFSFCVIKFCQSLPNFWLALNISIPYLIFVVGIGYTRQSVALGIVMYGFTLLEKKQIFSYILTLLAAFSFHSSAFINSIFLFFYIRSKYLFNKFVYLVIFFIGAYLIYDIFAEKIITNLIGAYITWNFYESAENILVSEGGFIRLIMLLIPSLIFLIFRRKFLISKYLQNQATIQSISTIFLFIVLIKYPLLSTPIDRLSLYLIPLQITILCYLVKIRLFNISPKLMKIFLLTYSSSVFFVWFKFSNHAFLWVPYRTILFNF